MITASTPFRSASACHSSSASPIRRAASSASRSSHDPGNWTTPNLTERLPPQGVRPCVLRRMIAFLALNLELLDQGIGEQPLAHLADPRGIVDVELDQPADVHVAHALEAERRQRALDGLALRVEDAGLGPDQDPHPQG